MLPTSDPLSGKSLEIQGELNRLAWQIPIFGQEISSGEMSPARQLQYETVLKQMLDRYFELVVELE